MAKRRIKIFDTTLRDGEQSPGASMTLEQKIEMAEALERLGVDRIEAGFPVSSPVQLEAVRRIGESVRESQVVGLARCTEKDIDAVYNALKGRDNGMLHVFIATSPLHMKYKLKKTEDEVIESMIHHLTYARKFFDQIEFSPEDGSRTEPEFMYRVVRTAIEQGATVFNLPDTVGYAMPAEYAQMITDIRKNVPEVEQIEISTHCHNDLGVAVANTEAGLMAGATQAEVTLNGIGERAGNCALEELVMAIEVRGDLLGLETGINTGLLYPTSKLLQNITGLVVPRNKPVFGDNAFSHESGIHQDGMLKHRETYEIMKPEKIGRHLETLVMGRHSGKHALKEKLAQYNIVLHGDQLDTVYDQFIRIADKKKEVYDEDLFPLVSGVLSDMSTGFHLGSFHAHTGDTLIPSATVKVIRDGSEMIGTAHGDGPVDAVFRAIDSCTGFSGELAEYVIQAVGHGKDAQGQVKLSVIFEKHSYPGKASSTDIIEASAMAYLNAMNRYLMKKNELGISQTRGEAEVTP